MLLIVLRCIFINFQHVSNLINFFFDNTIVLVHQTKSIACTLATLARAVSHILRLIDKCLVVRPQEQGLHNTDPVDRSVTRHTAEVAEHPSVMS